MTHRGISYGAVVLVLKNPPVQETEGLIPGSGRSPGAGNGTLLQCSCLANPCGRRSLVGYSPWSHKESDTTERESTDSKVWSPARICC